MQRYGSFMCFLRLLTLDLQVERDLIWPPVVAGHTAVVPRILCFDCADDEAAVAMDTTATIHQYRCRSSISAVKNVGKIITIGHDINEGLSCSSTTCVTYFPFSHLMVGGGSPTALHGKTMSFIQGVVTVPLKVRILAGAKNSTNIHT